MNVIVSHPSASLAISVSLNVPESSLKVAALLNGLATGTAGQAYRLALGAMIVMKSENSTIVAIERVEEKIII